MLYNTILKYCKCKRIKMTKTSNIYFLYHRSDRATIEVNQKDIILKYKGNNIKTNINTFISTLDIEINKEKKLSEFKRTSRPKKWQKSIHRNKITERGREYLFDCAMRMNGRNKDERNIQY